jgi:hypothetical protein
MGILGFLAGMAILVVLRTLQQLTPPMDPELAVILGAFTASAGFIWGLGAFDARMNVHAHEPAEGQAPFSVVPYEEPAQGKPGEILGSYIWLLSTLLLGLLLILVVFALLPEGPALRTVSDPLSDVAGVGFVDIELFGQTYQVSQLILLIAFVIFMFVSLAAFAGGAGMLFFGLHRGLTQVKDVSFTPLEAEPHEMIERSPNMPRWAVISTLVVAGFTLLDRLIGNPITNEFQTLSFFLTAAGVFTLSILLVGYIIRFVAAQTKWLWLVRAAIILGAIGLILNLVDFLVIWFGLAPLPLTTIAVLNLVILGVLLALRMVTAAIFMLISGILIPLFYFVLIGLVVAFPPPILFGASAGNALLIAALILRPRFLVRWLGYGASWTAKQLRRLPNALQ